MPYSCGQRICCRALVKIAEWKQNCLRHSFCSYAVALKGLEWISDQADHSIAILKRDYREVVTKADAEAYFDIAVKNFERSISGNSLLRRVSPPNALRFASVFETISVLGQLNGARAELE
jgi:hypothetical protein